MSLPDLTPTTLGFLALAVICFAAAGIVTMPATSAVTLGGIGMSIVTAIMVKRPGDVKAPKEKSE